MYILKGNKYICTRNGVLVKQREPKVLKECENGDVCTRIRNASLPNITTHTDLTISLDGYTREACDNNPQAFVAALLRLQLNNPCDQGQTRLLVPVPPMTHKAPNSNCHMVNLHGNHLLKPKHL